MGNRGRFGKYGEIKRLNRLRKSGLGPFRASGQRFRIPGYLTLPKNRAFFRNQLRITTARKIDIGFIRSLSRKVFRKYGAYDDMLSRWFVSGVALTILAKMGRRPVGYAMLGRSANKSISAHVFELLAIAVEPKMQRFGIGSLMMKDMERKARELQAEKLFLHTAVDNVYGRNFFRKHGFSAVETKINFYPEGQDALMMHKKLI